VLDQLFGADRGRAQSLSKHWMRRSHHNDDRRGSWLP
jgi:hypothetical protein